MTRIDIAFQAVVLPVLLSFAAVSTVTWAGQANALTPLCAPAGPMNWQEMHQFVGCVAEGLRDEVWAENILPGIEIAPGVDAPDRAIRLEITKGCSLVPAYDHNRGVVSFPHALFYFTLYFQQAMLFQFLGTSPGEGDEDLLSYYDDRLRPALVRERMACPGSDLQKTGRVSRQLPSIMDRRMTNAERDAIFRKVNSDPATDRFQAYVALSPVFFTLLHEVGHAVLHPDGSSGEDHEEIEADDYAAAVLNANGLPVIMGLGIHQIFHSASRGGNDSALACRVARLARNHPVPAAFVDEFGQDIANRLEHFRRFYADEYQRRCDA